MVRGHRLTLGIAIIGATMLVLMFGATLAFSPSAVAANVGPLPYLTVASMDLLPIAVVGGLLLVWASARARSHRLPICAGLCIGAASTISGMAWSPVVPTHALTWVGAVVIAWWLGLLLATSAGVSLVLSLIRRRSSADTTTASG